MEETVAVSACNNFGAAFDFDGFGERADLEGDVHGGRDTGIEREAGDELSLETGARDGHAIIAGDQAGDGPIAFLVGDSFEGLLLAQVDDFDLGTGDDRTCVIGYRAIDASRSDLGESDGSAAEQSDSECSKPHGPLQGTKIEF
ncbi:MAG: hypothetical protein WDO73_36975 [Ignavibacteriota bacterium]